MAEKAKGIAESVKDKALGNESAGSSNPIDERADTHSAPKKEDTDSTATNTVKAEINPILIGYGYDSVTLPSGDEVAAGKKKEVSQEDFDNAGQLRGFDKLISAEA